MKCMELKTKFLSLTIAQILKRAVCELSATNGPTDEPTDQPTKQLIELCARD